MPLVKQKVDIPTLLQRVFEEEEFNGPLTYCPFHTHNRDSPSFHCYEDGSRWRCYSCGKWGDVIDFWQRAYKLRTGKFLVFVEAVKSLALMAGIDASAATPAAVATIAQALRVNPRGNPTELHRALRAWGDEHLETLFNAVRFMGTSGAWERATYLEEWYEKVLSTPGKPKSVALRELREIEGVAFSFLRVSEAVEEILENVD